ITGLEFDPHAGANGRHREEARCRPAIGHAGLGPTGGLLAQHTWNESPQAAKAIRILVVLNRALVLPVKRLCSVSGVLIRLVQHANSFQAAGASGSEKISAPVSPVALREAVK